MRIAGGRLRGQLGKRVIASSWRGIPYLREYVKPRNPRTKRQQKHRGRFGEAVAAWKGLSRTEQRAYDRRAVRMTGLNLFIQEYLKSGAARRRKRPLA